MISKEDLFSSIKTAVILATVILVLTGVYGYVWVWYRSTGFDEQNAPGKKAQELPGPLMLPGTTVEEIKLQGGPRRTPLSIYAGQAVARGTSIMAGGNVEPLIEARIEAKGLKNPYPATKESLEKGKLYYTNSCSPCHGLNGEGVGIMGTVPNLSPLSKRERDELRKYINQYLGFDPKFDTNFVRNMTDGELYFTITYGGVSIMPSYSDALTPEQRWHLINYIKKGLANEYL